jgi:hypothetical protein
MSPNMVGEAIRIVQVGAKMSDFNVGWFAVCHMELGNVGFP